MASAQEIKEVFPAMVQRFVPEKAEGVDAIIKFDLSGDNGGLFWLKIANGKVEHGAGDIESPAMTMRMLADDFYALVGGKLNPMMAFMQGKIKVDNTGLGMKMMAMFQMG